MTDTSSQFSHKRYVKLCVSVILHNAFVTHPFIDVRIILICTPVLTNIHDLPVSLTVYPDCTD